MLIVKCSVHLVAVVEHLPNVSVKKQNFWDEHSGRSRLGSSMSKSAFKTLFLSFARLQLHLSDQNPAIDLARAAFLMGLPAHVA